MIQYWVQGAVYDTNTLEQLNDFGKVAWNFVSAVYQSKWDRLFTSDNITFREQVSAQFKGPNKSIPSQPTSTNESSHNQPRARVAKVPPPIPPHPSAKTRKKWDEERNKETQSKTPKKSYCHKLHLDISP